MKPILSFFLFFQSLYALSQNTEIIKILNRELQNEIRAQKADAQNYYGQKFEIVKNFTIRDSIVTTKAIKTNGEHETLIQDRIKILSLEVKKKNHYSEDYYTEKQEVDLHKIKFIVKDINIILETEPDAVKITHTNEKGEKTIKTHDLFFLHLSYEKQNEHLATELIKAFKNAGCTIQIGYWHD